MAVQSQSFRGLPGQWWVTNSELTNVIILGVKRSGVGHNEKSTDPTGFERSFHYVQSDGKIVFSQDQPFVTPPLAQPGEYVFVIWKT